jgi:hypothetical protein
MKGPWEKRVGSLLDTFCPYKYKPVDSPMHGGAVRIDWLACDNFGTFVAVEVKQVERTRVSLNLEHPKQISPLQIEALNCIAEATTSLPILVIGRDDILYIWGWRHVWAQYQWRKREAVYQPDGFRPELLPLSTATTAQRFTTEKEWKEYSLVFTRGLVNSAGLPKDHRLARMLNKLAPSSSDPVRLAWIARQGDMSADSSVTSEPRVSTRTRAPRAGSGRRASPARGMVRLR